MCTGEILYLYTWLFLERLLKKFRANGTIKPKHISIKFKAVMPSDILNSLQKSMLLNPVKKEQKGYFRKKTEQQKWDGCKHFYENTGRR